MMRVGVSGSTPLLLVGLFHLVPSLNAGHPPNFSDEFSGVQLDLSKWDRTGGGGGSLTVAGGKLGLRGGTKTTSGTNRVEIQSQLRFHGGTLRFSIESSSLKPHTAPTSTSFGFNVLGGSGARCHFSVQFEGSGHFVLLRSVPDANNDCSGEPQLRNVIRISNWDALRSRARLFIEIAWTQAQARVVVDDGGGLRGEASYSGQGIPAEAMKIRINVEEEEGYQVDFVHFNAIRPPLCSPHGALPGAFLSCRNWITFQPPAPFDPRQQIFPAETQIRQVLTQLYDEGWRGLVTYAMDASLAQIPRLAKEAGFSKVVAGLYWYNNATYAIERQAAMGQLAYIDAFVVGTEGLCGDRCGRPPINRQELESEILRLRNDSGLPVATNEPDFVYRNDPSVLQLGDWVFVNIHPWWGNQRSPANAASWTRDIYQDLRGRISPDRVIVVRETWWPTAADAAAGEENQTAYFQHLSQQTSPTPFPQPVLFVYGEAYDQFWKQEPGGQGPFWGMHTTQGVAKRVISGARGFYTDRYFSDPACSFSLSGPSNLPSSGGDFSVTLSTASSCRWTANSECSWIAPISATSGAGSATLSFSFPPNAGSSPRTGSIVAGGQAFPVLQNGQPQVRIFDDVPVTHLFASHIELLKQKTITLGCGPTIYCTDTATTRGQMAAFLIRAIEGGDSFAYPDAAYFTDVNPTHPQFRHIQQLRHYGITSGCSPTLFCPDEPVTRGQMAVFLVRALLGIASDAPFAFRASPFFYDVPPSHPFFPFIQKLRETGITLGCSATHYCPDDHVSRGQMAAFLIRAFNR